MIVDFSAGSGRLTGTPCGAHRSWSLALLATLATGRAVACATCGCTLSADAAMGYSALPGWRLSLEYDYINQDELRSGTHSVVGRPRRQRTRARHAESLCHRGVELHAQLRLERRPAGALRHPRSLDLRRLRLDPAAAAAELLAQLEHRRPQADRQLPGLAADPQPRRAARRQAADRAATARRWISTSGPNAGMPLDASLQPGTGSTDLIVGAYYYRAISQNFDAFVNAQFQSARQPPHGPAGQRLPARQFHHRQPRAAL